MATGLLTATCELERSVKEILEMQDELTTSNGRHGLHLFAGLFATRGPSGGPRGMDRRDRFGTYGLVVSPAAGGYFGGSREGYWRTCLLTSYRATWQTQKQ